VTASCRQIPAVRNEWVTNYGIAPFEVFDPFSYLLHPASVFVSHDVRQFHVHFLTPKAFDHMEIGTANASAADSNKYIRLLFNFWLWHFLPDHEVRVRKSSVVLMKNGGFHNWGD
jgi:hypothetical protein